jgi:RIO kinase 1
MSRNALYEWVDELEVIPQDDGISEKMMTMPVKKAVRQKKVKTRLEKKVLDPGDRGKDFEFTYHASRHERQWIIDSLGSFHEMHWIDDVTRLIKGGKEATVYLCPAGDFVTAQWVAAKVYRPRRFRNLKNDKLYRQGRHELDDTGRAIIDGGMLHAAKKKTDFGLEILHASWIGHEYKTMQILHQAGVDIPLPYECANNAILMEYIGEEGIPAPSLNGIELPLPEARRLFKKVLRNIEIMLAHDRIHADLSAYNILYWEGEIKIIDFPQAIHPDENKYAYDIFARDVMRVCEYFAAQGIHSDPERMAEEIWQASGRVKISAVPDELLDE